ITRGEGSCVNRFEACSAFTSRYGLHARQVTYVTLYTGGSDGFVSSTAAPIASGWSEPSSRAGLSPAVDQCLFTAHVLSRFFPNNRIVSCLPTNRPQPPDAIQAANELVFLRVARYTTMSPRLGRGETGSTPSNPGA